MDSKQHWDSFHKGNVHFLDKINIHQPDTTGANKTFLIYWGLLPKIPTKIKKRTNNVGEKLNIYMVLFWKCCSSGCLCLGVCVCRHFFSHFFSQCNGFSLKVIFHMEVTDFPLKHIVYINKDGQIASFFSSMYSDQFYSTGQHPSQGLSLEEMRRNFQYPPIDRNGKFSD